MRQSLPNDLFINSKFWQDKTSSLSHPVAIRMLEDLDSSGSIGIGDSSKAFWKSFKHYYGDKDSNMGLSRITFFYKKFPKYFIFSMF
jgi:hypothetical protein